MSIMNFISSFF